MRLRPELVIEYLILGVLVAMIWRYATWSGLCFPARVVRARHASSRRDFALFCIGITIAIGVKVICWPIVVPFELWAAYKYFKTGGMTNVNVPPVQPSGGQSQRGDIVDCRTCHCRTCLTDKCPKCGNGPYPDGPSCQDLVGGQCLAELVGQPQEEPPREVAQIKCPHEECDQQARVTAGDWRAPGIYRVECAAGHWGTLEPWSDRLPVELRMPKRENPFTQHAAFGLGKVVKGGGSASVYPCPDRSGWVVHVTLDVDQTATFPPEFARLEGLTAAVWESEAQAVLEATRVLVELTGEPVIWFDSQPVPDGLSYRCGHCGAHVSVDPQLVADSYAHVRCGVCARDRCPACTGPCNFTPLKEATIHNA